MDSKKVGIGIGIILLIAAIVGFIFLFPKEDKEIIYKVTFDNDGVIEVVDVKEFDTVVRPVEPTKEGYTFEGWYYNGTKFDFTTGITRNITLEARWTEATAKKWVITFDTAGGKYIENLNVVDGQKIEQIPTPTKDGYKFIGWYYNDQAFDFETIVTKNMILTAKWEKIETSNEPVKTTNYTVKFDTAGGSSVKSQTVAKNKTASRPNDPTKEGYTFVGWYLGTTEFNFKTKITKNITLTAKWQKIETPVEPEQPTVYTVKFDTAGGNNIAEQKVKEGQTVTKPNDPIRDGYDFVGWYYNDTQYNFSTEVSSNMTLVAKWKTKAVITYTIEEIEDSYVGQVRIFVLKGTDKVDGVVDITTINGKVVTKEISKDGYVTNGAIIKSIDNVKVK